MQGGGLGGGLIFFQARLRAGMRGGLVETLNINGAGPFTII